MSFLDFEGTDPVSASREAADAITAARKDVEQRGVKAFLFASASAEEFDQRAEFSEVPDILDEVADKYLGSPDQRAKLTATLRREFVATNPTFQVMGPNVRTYVHPNAGCSADGQEQVVDADQTALGAGPVCPHCQVRFSVKPDKTGSTNAHMGDDLGFHDDSYEDRVTPEDRQQMYENMLDEVNRHPGKDKPTERPDGSTDPDAADFMRKQRNLEGMRNMLNPPTEDDLASDQDGPKSSHEDCNIEPDGEDYNGDEWSRCTVHNRSVFGDAPVCEGYVPPPYYGGSKTAEYNDRNDSDVQRANAELAEMRGLTYTDDYEAPPGRELCRKCRGAGELDGGDLGMRTCNSCGGSGVAHDHSVCLQRHSADQCGGCPAGTKCVCTHDGCRCVKTSAKTATNVPTGGDINEDRFNQFSDVYRVELEKAVKEHPEEYVWPVDQVPVVHGRMMDAVRNGSYNKDSRAIKSTVKALGVKHTYSGIREWLTSSDENNPPVRSARIKTAEIVECPTCEEEMEDTDPFCPNGHPNENEYFSRGPGRKRPYGAAGLAVWQEHCPTCGSVKNKLDDNDEYNNPICPGCDPVGHAAAQTALDDRARAEYQSESYAERGPNVDNAGPPTSPYYEEDGIQQFDPHWHSYEGRTSASTGDRGETADGRVPYCGDCGNRFDAASVNDKTVGNGEYYCGAGCGEMKSQSRGEIDWKHPQDEGDDDDFSYQSSRKQASDFSLAREIAGMEHGEHRKYTSGDAEFGVSYYERQAYGDNGQLVPNNTVGEFTITHPNGRTEDIHKSPETGGNSKYWAAEQVAKRMMTHWQRDKMNRLMNPDQKDSSVKACTMCEQPVENLRDDASRKEASLSGLCQGCQDAYFGKNENTATTRKVAQDSYRDLGDDEPDTRNPYDTPTCKGCGAWLSPVTKAMDDFPYCTKCIKDGVPDRQGSVTRLPDWIENSKIAGPVVRPGRTYNEWRAVSPEDSKRIHCSGADSEHRCDQPATWCNQWATDQMAAPAFYYYCQDHAAQRK